jgi:hypothetical protein
MVSFRSAIAARHTGPRLTVSSVDQRPRSSLGETREQAEAGTLPRPPSRGVANAWLSWAQ